MLIPHPFLKILQVDVCFRFCVSIFHAFNESKRVIVCLICSKHVAGIKLLCEIALKSRLKRFEGVWFILFCLSCFLTVRKNLAKYISSSLCGMSYKFLTSFRCSFRIHSLKFFKSTVVLDFVFLFFMLSTKANVSLSVSFILMSFYSSISPSNVKNTIR